MLYVHATAFSEDSLSVKVLDAETQKALIGATVQLNLAQGAITNENGQAKLPIPTNAATIQITVSYVGFEEYNTTLSSSQFDQLLVVELTAGEELEEVYVTTNRSGRTIANTPTRVEAIDAEELNEKAIMRSANIAMLLRESTGILMQTTSVAAANQNIRMQGLDGRYTQLLKDGFPIYGGFSSGLSIMQIPPLDLQQVEIVKGSNSTLYGGGAIAGLVNLVSIQPKEEALLKVMVDQTSALGSTVNTFYAKRNERFGISLYGSVNRQQVYDANGDNFSDIPEITSFTLNPVFYWYPNEKSTFRLAFNITRENRFGGNLAIVKGDEPLAFGFSQENESSRNAIQLSYSTVLKNGLLFSVKHSSNYFERGITEFDYYFEGSQLATFTESTLRYTNTKTDLIGGLVIQTDNFLQSGYNIPAAFRDKPGLYDPIFLGYENRVGGAFVQFTNDITQRFSLEAGLRFEQSFDFDQVYGLGYDYGSFLMPRLSLLYKINEKLSFRLGGGSGYMLPTVFNEEAESLAFRVGNIPLNPLLNVERSQGLNFDVNYNTTFGEDWTLSFNQLFFSTQIEDAVVLQDNSFVNANDLVRTQGIESNFKLTYKDYKFFANYAFLDTELSFTDDKRAIPLTPRHNFGGVLVYEVEGKWRLGLESYYKSEQFRRNGSATDDFWLFGFMALRKFEHFSIYANFENFTDTRQHRLENFRASDHFIPNIPDIWAPLDGRVINAGFIYEF